MKRYLLSAIIVFSSLLVLAGCFEARSISGEEVPSWAKSLSNSGIINDIVPLLDKISYDENNKIWPDYSWKYGQVLLVDSESREALLWNDLIDSDGKSPKKTVLPYDEVPTEFLKGTYSFSEYNNIKTMGIIVNNLDDFSLLVKLIFHEGFHFFGQDHWYFNNRGIHGYNYPENWAPRYYREQIIFYLQERVKSTDDELLEKAAFWYYKWKDEFKNDYIELSDLDRIEGSAEYVSELAFATAMLDKKSDNSDILNYIVKNHKDYDLPVSKSRESYIIGHLAGIILKEKDIYNWENRLKEGETFLDILFENITPISGGDNPELLNSVKNFYTEKNRATGDAIIPFMESYKSNEYINIVVPLSWMLGSFTTDGIINTVFENEKYSIGLNLKAEFESLSGFTIKSTGMNAETGGYGIESYFFPVKKEDIFEDINGNISIYTDELTVESLRFEAVEDNDGKIWYYLK